MNTGETVFWLDVQGKLHTGVLREKWLTSTNGMSRHRGWYIEGVTKTAHIAPEHLLTAAEVVRLFNERVAA